jgi:glucokinase
MPPSKLPSGTFAGIDLGGTNMQLGIVACGTKSDDAKIIGESKKKTKSDEGQDAVIGRICEGVVEACAAAKVSVKDLSGIGIGAPGAVDPHEGVVLEAVNLRWDDVPLAAILQKRLGVPVYLDNDVNVAVYGEKVLGAGRGFDDLVGIWIGTGVGGGLVLNGKMYYGHYFTSGEIGHTLLLPNNPPGHRSLEHNCSRTALVERIIRLIAGNRKSIIPKLVDGDLSKIKSKTLARAYEENDLLTREVIDDAADMIGVAAANVVTLLSIPRVVLGGGLTEAIGKPFVERVQASCRRFAFPERCKQVTVVASELMDHAGVYGAAMIARDRAN